jgi:hypothetical protein
VEDENGGAEAADEGVEHGYNAGESGRKIRDGASTDKSQ